VSLISQLLPPGVSGVEMRGGDAPLHVAEAALVAGAVEKRRREFALGRACARSALAAMGVEAGPILRGTDGAPLWPDGVVGSISHTEGYACAVVGPSSRFTAMGVDVEPIGGVGDELLPRLFDDTERARLMAMSAQKRRIAATLGFSAKEACFKAFGTCFHDIHMEWGDGIFRTERGEGRFLVADGLALTLIAF